MTMTVHPVRGVVLVGSSGAAGVWLAQQGALALGAGPTLETALVAAVALGGAAAALGVSVTTLIALGESVFGRRAPRATQSLPAPLRRFLLGSVATAAAVGMVIPASADETYPGWTAPQTSVTASPSPSPSPVPSQAAEPSASPSAAVDPPVVAAPPAEVVELHAESAAGPLDGSGVVGSAEPGHRAGGDGEDRVHVVARGESLWRIAAELLGPDASAADIAAAWHAIYLANRDLIGADPGLILPGQGLVVPHGVAA